MSLYRIVLPAASRPNIKISISFSQKRPARRCEEEGLDEDLRPSTETGDTTVKRPGEEEEKEGLDEDLCPSAEMGDTTVKRPGEEEEEEGLVSGVRRLHLQRDRSSTCQRK